METIAVSRIDRTRKVLSQDTFVYSKSMDRDIDTYYKDCVEDYETLAQHIRDGVIEQLNLKSMAYEDKNAYSLVTHTHDYTKVSIDSFNTKGSRRDKVNEQNGQLSILAQIDIDGVKTNINALAAVNPEAPKIDVGTLMFVAWTKLAPIDETSEDFDGYVYPDGRRLNKADFPDAYDCFGDEYRRSDDPEDTFRIPILSDFISLNPMETQTECCKRNGFQNGIESHTHEWQLSMEGTSRQIEIQVGVGGANWNQGGIHQGDLNSATMPAKITNAQVRLSSDNLYLDNDFDAETKLQQIVEEESTPNYMLLPVLMYIGKKSGSPTPSPSPSPTPSMSLAGVVDEAYDSYITDEASQSVIRGE